MTQTLLPPPLIQDKDLVRLISDLSAIREAIPADLSKETKVIIDQWLSSFGLEQQGSARYHEKLGDFRLKYGPALQKFGKRLDVEVLSINISGDELLHVMRLADWGETPSTDKDFLGKANVFANLSAAKQHMGVVDFKSKALQQDLPKLHSARLEFDKVSREEGILALQWLARVEGDEARQIWDGFCNVKSWVDKQVNEYANSVVEESVRAVQKCCKILVPKSVNGDESFRVFCIQKLQPLLTKASEEFEKAKGKLKVFGKTVTSYPPLEEQSEVICEGKAQVNEMAMLVILNQRHTMNLLKGKSLRESLKKLYDIVANPENGLAKYVRAETMTKCQQATSQATY